MQKRLLLWFASMPLSQYTHAGLERLMNVLAVRHCKLTYPTGNKSFSVMQAFPGAFSTEESDPFLMCDIFGPKPSAGLELDPDSFPVGWHPHRGQDVVTYMREGVVRHADSLGNRVSFPAPGMQWCCARSGIEHAEGGGTPKGHMEHGFQIWVNVPSVQKMDDPTYGVEPRENIPFVFDASNGSEVRVLAGPFLDAQSSTLRIGPFKTSVKALMLDVTVPPSQRWSYTIGEEGKDFNNALLVCYQGSGAVHDADGRRYSVASFDAVRLDMNSRAKQLQVSASGEMPFQLIVFVGKRLDEPVAWHGPIVMSTEAQLAIAFEELRNHTFLKRSASWDWKKIASFPPGALQAPK